MIEVVGKRLHQSARLCISDTGADGLRMTRAMELAGKVCLVTGGASGIGAMTALAFSRRGAQIAVTGLGPRIDSPETRKVPPAADVPGVLYLQSDASIAEDCKRAVAETVARYGRLDVLVHAAGGAVPGGFFEVTEESWLKAFDVHVHAVLRLARAAVPHMIEQGEGAIVLISSAAGHRGCLGALAYGVAKGALPQFTRTLAFELADHNIRVNCVSPGIIRTPFQDMLTPAQVENNIKNRIPLHREGKPENVARAILDFVENDFITGEDLAIDGGMAMRIV
jgi:NAD(P)-dependent dehydrogenase (short-subunit alcohol dehydrogenase family)